MIEFFFQKIISPIVAEIIIRVVYRYMKDSLFREKVNEVLEMVKSSNTEEEVINAAKALHHTLNAPIEP